MEMPKEFYELTELGHKTNDRDVKVGAIRSLENLLKEGSDMGPYKKKALMLEINDLKNEANKMIIGNVLDKGIFNPRFIRSVMAAASIESKLLEEITETNESFKLVKYMLDHNGEDFKVSADLENVTRYARVNGKTVLVDFSGNEIKESEE